MDLFLADDTLNPLAFAFEIRQSTHELRDILIAAQNTQSALIESTHFLMALGEIPDSITQKTLAHLGLTPAQWQGGLAQCARKQADALPSARLTKSALDLSAQELLQAAVERSKTEPGELISERALLLCALQHATPEVQKLFESAGLDREQLCRDLTEALQPLREIAVYEPAPKPAEKGGEADGHPLRRAAFTPGAWKVLQLAHREAESLGYAEVDPRHLLLALLSREGQITAYSLYPQGIPPRKIQEAVMLNLRRKSKRTRSMAPLSRKYQQPILQNILALASRMAAQERTERIAERHLFGAFLATESAARYILEDEGVKIALLLETMAHYEEDADAESEDEEDISAVQIDAVRNRLQDRLVGQDEAIERILPYVQRMIFGFATPGRPVGVFLFCGQSGSGKTEMAKGLAQAVYGSEEQLIFLEMGQFNAKESMNIFVGAPPGYVGYGEGKLTNGLRDKPKAVVLFDEVEKAHPLVLDALLRFLDEGKIDDPAGPVRDGSECIVILTSNVGAKELSALWQEIEQSGRKWRRMVRDRLREAFEKHHFRIEFLNRVDELILFRTLTQEHYAEIAQILLERNRVRLEKERSITVTCDPGVIEAISSFCAQVNEGARLTQRLTQSVVITPVIDFVLRHDCTPPVRLVVRALASDDPEEEPEGIVELASAPAAPTLW